MYISGIWGANLYCDSANFFQETNSFEAFGHVKMLQGDTLKLFSDYAYYDGNAQIAQARYNVILKHRQSTLYTDSLDYDRLYNFGNFFEGGKLVDNGSTLTSDWESIIRIPRWRCSIMTFVCVTRSSI